MCDTSSTKNLTSLIDIYKQWIEEEEAQSQEKAVKRLKELVQELEAITEREDKDGKL